MERQVEVDPLEVVDPDPPEPDASRVVAHRSSRPSMTLPHESWSSFARPSIVRPGNAAIESGQSQATIFHGRSRPIDDAAAHELFRSGEMAQGEIGPASGR